MADIIYSWRNLEADILEARIGYLHGNLTKFNEYKDRHPDSIWIVRLEQETVWLLARLKVTDIRPKNLPPLEKHRIFYDPNRSFFFTDPVAIREKVAPFIDAACARMLRGNMQGVNAADILEPSSQRHFEMALRDVTQISIADFSKQLREGNVLSPPFRLKSAVRSKKANKSYSAVPRSSIETSVVESNSGESIKALESDRDGPSYQDDPEKRKCTEAYAEKWAKQHYERQGFVVEKRGKPFDLLCKRGSLEFHVEVKGSVGRAATVTLTRNEVADARNPAWRSDLFIVRDIVLTAVDASWEASGGNYLCFEAWQPEDVDLTPTEYEYRVPKSP